MKRWKVRTGLKRVLRYSLVVVSSAEIAPKPPLIFSTLPRRLRNFRILFLDMTFAQRAIAQDPFLRLRCGDHFNFQQSVLGEPRDLHGGTRGWRGGEIARVDFIHGRESVEVFEEDGGLADVMEVRASGLQNALDILENALRLLPDVGTSHFAGFGIERNLPGKIHEAVRFDRLRVGPDGLWAAVGDDDIFHGALSFRLTTDAVESS